MPNPAKRLWAAGIVSAEVPAASAAHMPFDDAFNEPMPAGGSWAPGIADDGMKSDVRHRKPTRLEPKPVSVRSPKDDPIEPQALAAALGADGRHAWRVTIWCSSIASAAIATLGLLENNAAVIIGAMIVAPLIAPIQALAFGAIAGTVGSYCKRPWQSLQELPSQLPLPPCWNSSFRSRCSDREILARQPTLLDLGVAVAAGAVSGFAKTRPSILSTLAGTAIAVALMPPVALSALPWAPDEVSLSARSCCM